MYKINNQINLADYKGSHLKKFSRALVGLRQTLRGSVAGPDWSMALKSCGTAHIGILIQSLRDSYSDPETQLCWNHAGNWIELIKRRMND